MNTNTAYTQDEMELIRQYETSRLEGAASAFEAIKSELQQAKPTADRWDTEEFTKKVLTARKAFGEWAMVMITLFASYLLNCVLIQELTPDFAPMVARMLPFMAEYANGIATIIMTTLLFSLLLMIKDKCNITEELGSLRPGMHVAVTAPIRRSIALKTGVKIIYLLVLAYGYGKLYDYIAGGVQLEQRAAETANVLTKSATISISGAGPDLSSLDAEIASSQAASFAVYYTIEWFLHATILFLGTSHWFSHGFDIALASKRRDKKRYGEVSKRHASAQARLKTLSQPHAEDDGVNELRAAILAGLMPDIEGVRPTTPTNNSGDADNVKANTDALAPFKANGSTAGHRFTTT
jgi:hypothetical protein